MLQKYLYEGSLIKSVATNVAKFCDAFISTPKLFHFMLSWHAFFVHQEPRVNQIFHFAKDFNTDKILLKNILSS